MTDTQLAGPPLRLPKSLTADRIDAAFMELGSELPENLTVDLGDVAFVETTALLYLAAVLVTLHRRGIGLALELPRDKRVRDFMRRYRFGAALGELMETSPNALLTATSRQHAGEPAEHYLRSFRSRASDKLAELSVMSDVTIDAAIRTIDAWDAPEIGSFLERSLGGRANLVAPGIIYEALANAVRHPKASSVTSTAFLSQEATKRHPHGLLTVAFWDDGDSIVSTLRSAMDSPRPLRSEDFALYYDWYGVYVADRHGASKEYQGRMYSGDPIPTEDKPKPDDLEVLIAATFPGITSDSLSERPLSGTAGLGPKFDRPGMGLYILTSLAIDSFGGEVLLRSGDMQANFRRASADEHRQQDFRYRVGVVRDPAMGQYFSGNYVVIRLPLIG